LLLQLVDRRRFDRDIGVFVTDEPRRKLDATAVRPDARLVNEDDLALIFGNYDNGADVARAARIFPFAALQQAHELALAHQLGRGHFIQIHSSISLSGISFTSPSERGKCSASTTPTCSIAATMPSPGRPSRTCSSNTAMASPQVLSSVTFRIASSATISARRSPIER